MREVCLTATIWIVIEQDQIVMSVMNGSGSGTKVFYCDQNAHLAYQRPFGGCWRSGHGDLAWLAAAIAPR